MSSDLYFQFHFLPVKGNILPVRSRAQALVGVQLWPAHRGLVPGPFISFSEDRRGGKCNDMNLQIVSLAETRNIVLPSETSLRNFQVLFLTGRGWMSCWYWVIPYEQDWKVKALERKSSASLGEECKTKKAKILVKTGRMKITASSNSPIKIFSLNAFLPTWWVWLCDDYHPPSQKKGKEKTKHFYGLAIWLSSNTLCFLKSQLTMEN